MEYVIAFYLGTALAALTGMLVGKVVAKHVLKPQTPTPPPGGQLPEDEDRISPWELAKRIES